LTTFGARIHSTVHEFEGMARIGWYGQTDQWLAYHSWLLEPRDEGTTYVVMEETGTGANPKKLARSNPGPARPGRFTRSLRVSIGLSTRSLRRRRQARRRRRG